MKTAISVVTMACLIAISAAAQVPQIQSLPRPMSGERIKELFERIGTPGKVAGKSATITQTHLQLMAKPFYGKNEPLVVMVAGTDFPRTPPISLYFRVTTEGTTRHFQGNCGDYGLGYFPMGIAVNDFITCYVWIPTNGDTMGARQIVEVLAYANSEFNTAYDHVVAIATLQQEVNDDFINPLVINDAHLSQSFWELDGRFPINQNINVILSAGGDVTNFGNAVSSDGTTLKFPAVSVLEQKITTGQFVVRVGELSATSMSVAITK